MARPPIASTLQRIGRGKFADKLADQLQQLTAEVQETQRAGTLVIAIRVAPAAKGGALVIEGKSDIKLPKTDALDTLMWADDDGSLVDHDPRQSQIPGLAPVESMSRTGS